MLNVLIRECLQQRIARVNRPIRREVAAEDRLLKKGRKEDIEPDRSGKSSIFCQISCKMHSLWYTLIFSNSLYFSVVFSGGLRAVFYSSVRAEKIFCLYIFIFLKHREM